MCLLCFSNCEFWMWGCLRLGCLGFVVSEQKFYVFGCVGCMGFGILGVKFYLCLILGGGRLETRVEHRQGSGIWFEGNGLLSCTSPASIVPCTALRGAVHRSKGTVCFPTFIQSTLPYYKRGIY